MTESGPVSLSSARPDARRPADSLSSRPPLGSWAVATARRSRMNDSPTPLDRPGFWGVFPRRSLAFHDRSGLFVASLIAAQSLLTLGVTTPVLVIHGDADALLPAAHGRDIAARIPGARYEEIAGMGHDLDGGVGAIVVGMVAGFVGAP